MGQNVSSLSDGSVTECLRTASTLFAIDRLDEALALAVCVTQSANDNPDGFSLVGNICLRLASLEEHRQQHGDAYQLSSKQLSRRYYSHAATHLKAALERGSTDAAVMIALAASYLRLNDSGKARDQLGAIQHYQLLPTSDRVRLAECYAVLDEPTKAFEALSGLYDAELSDYRRLSISLFRSIARILLSLQKNLDAVRFLDRAGDDVKGQLIHEYVTALDNLGRWDDASAFIDRALRQRRTVNALKALALLRTRLDDPVGALAAFDEALALSAHDAALHLGKAECLIALGRWRDSWPYWESRWRLPSFGNRPMFESARPLSSESIRGKRVLLYREQGLGDTIMFVRFAPVISDLGAEVTVLAPTALAGVLTTLRGARIVTEVGNPMDYDECIPLLSLPAILNTTVDSLPQHVPYLSANGALRRRWNDYMGQCTDGSSLKVGVVWRGNPRHPDDFRRSVSLSQVASLAEVPGIRLFSLQTGRASIRTAGLRPFFTIEDLEPFITDFSDTAAIIASLDLVISVDTAVAHLAGSMGCPVWILLPSGAAPFWMRRSRTTPLYPTATLFRQDSTRQWEGVMNEITKELAALSGAHGRRPV